MNLPEKSSIQYRRTSTAREDGGKLLVTGPPGSGKTALVAAMAKALVGPDQSFLMDWPEEGGTGTLTDLDIPYYTFTKQAELDTVYSDMVRVIKPLAILWDSAPSAYECFMIHEQVVRPLDVEAREVTHASGEARHEHHGEQNDDDRPAFPACPYTVDATPQLHVLTTFHGPKPVSLA
jgi:energy-coupling factor transporter ATP-binding protein EcfA2